MANPEVSFEFLGHHVHIESSEQGGQWCWAYAIDGGAPVRMAGSGAWSQHGAIEEAGMAARDVIRSAVNPGWEETDRMSRF